MPVALWLGLACAGFTAAGAPAMEDVAADAARRCARIERSIRSTANGADGGGRPLRLLDRMRTDRIPSLSVAVIDDRRVAWAKAYGFADVAERRPADIGTLFQAASLSKPIAATLALRLAEAGTISLDADVNRALASWTLPESELAAGRTVTFRAILAHAAGISVHGFPGYEVDEPSPTLLQILDGTAPANTQPVRIIASPGDEIRYSGGGYCVLQQAVVDRTGGSFAEAAERLVLQPAGMTSSLFCERLPVERAGRACSAYREDGTAIAGRYHAYPELAAAGLWTTPTDMARWIVAIQRSVSADGLLRRASAEAMMTPARTRRSDPGSGNGLGVMLEGSGPDGCFSHAGSNAGFRCLFVAKIHAGSGAVVMTNSDAGANLARDLIAAIRQEYAW